MKELDRDDIDINKIVIYLPVPVVFRHYGCFNLKKEKKILSN